MILLAGHEIKKWDQYTIAHKPISSLDLMEEAATKFCNWFTHHFYLSSVAIFCGSGNNGGDGLAIARILRCQGNNVSVFIHPVGNQFTSDCNHNLIRLEKLHDVEVIDLTKNKTVNVPEEAIIIDALLGIGTNRVPEGSLLDWIEFINGLPNKVVSVDIPSGMPTEDIVSGNCVIADHVVSFQLPKISFFLQENAKFMKAWCVLNIGLLPRYLDTLSAHKFLVDDTIIKPIYKIRHKYSHKGSHGHVAMVGGASSTFGAILLASKASLRSGTGTCTCITEINNFAITNVYMPEIMCITPQHFFSIQNTNKYTLGIGPGMGQSEASEELLSTIIEHLTQPAVFDADALNIIARRKNLLSRVPPNSIFTPHKKEFQRLFGSSENTKTMFDLAAKSAKTYNIIIVLKGAHSRIFTPNGFEYINNTGHNGMATAGSGDVLTGIITSFLSQNYTPESAAIMGVYIHGLAADLALSVESHESLVASDIIKYLGLAFKHISKS